MNDDNIMYSISSLVDEEHALMRKAEEEEGGLNEDEQARMHELEVRLDQCWDLLRQRRAHREFGQNPEEAKVRDPSIVEHYQQ